MSYRTTYLMCPTGPSGENPPSIADQIRTQLRGSYNTWRPPQECTFTLRDLAAGETRPTLQGYYRDWRPQFAQGSQIWSSDDNARIIASQYRCAEHGLTPRVFRQQAAYLRHRDARPNMPRFARVRTAANGGRGDPRAPWPPDVEPPYDSFALYVYVPLRPPPRSTHSLWPST